MTIQEAIRILDPETTAEALAEIEYYAGFSGPTAKARAVSDACEVVVAELRRLMALDQPNQPLTLDELRGMDGEPVWIDDWYEDVHGWELSCDASDYLEGRDITQYGGSWLAYRHKPEEVTKE